MTNHNINFSGASIGAVNVDSTVEGTQIGTQYNYGSSVEDIVRLLSALQEQVQTFPSKQREEAVELIEDVRADLSAPKLETSRIRQRLKQLATIAAAAGIAMSGLSDFTEDLNDFSRSFVNLTETIGIPIEQVLPNRLPPNDKP